MRCSLSRGLFISGHVDHSFQCIAQSAAAILMSVTLTCSVCASAQSGSETAALQDPAAVSAVKMAIMSMGGTTSFRSIKDATVTAQANPPNPLMNAPAGQITWMTIGMSIRSATTTQSEKSVYTVQNGKGLVEDASGKVTPMDSRLALTLFPFHLPGAVLLNLLNTSNESMSVVQDAGASTNIVHVRFQEQMSDPSLAPVTQQDWYIDMRTGLPSRVDYYLPNITNPSLDGTATILFTSWQKTPTILMVCPALFVPVDVRETGMRGALNGTREEAYARTDSEPTSSS
jgi:hypothetical protein